MGKGTLIYVWIQVVVSIFLIVICSIPIRNKKIKIKCKVSEKQPIKIKRTFYIVLWTIRIIRGIILIDTIIYGLIPFVLDIPYMVKENYPVISGTVIKKFSDGKGTTICIQNKVTGEKTEVDLIGGGAELSDKVEIIYFPHQKIGNVVK